jgi:hypothetical protein
LRKIFLRREKLSVPMVVTKRKMRRSFRIANEIGLPEKSKSRTSTLSFARKRRYPSSFFLSSRLTTFNASSFFEIHVRRPRTVQKGATSAMYFAMYTVMPSSPR